MPEERNQQFSRLSEFTDSHMKDRNYTALARNLEAAGRSPREVVEITIDVDERTWAVGASSPFVVADWDSENLRETERGVISLGPILDGLKLKLFIGGVTIGLDFPPVLSVPTVIESATAPPHEISTTEHQPKELA